MSADVETSSRLFKPVRWRCGMSVLIVGKKGEGWQVVERMAERGIA